MYEYPDPNVTGEATSFTVGIHILLVAVVLMPFVILFLQSKRPASRMDAIVFVLASISGIIGAAIASQNATAYTRPFIIGYAVVFQIVLAIAFITTLVRLSQGGKGMLVVRLLASLLVLACVIGMLLPAVPSAREAARRVQCANNLKQIGLAMQNYHDIQKVFPSPLGTSKTTPVSWRVSILPYAENQALYELYDQQVTWDAEPNLQVAQTANSNMNCPSNPRVEDGNGRYFTAYSIPTGDGTFFGNNESRTLEDATGGTSNTIMVVEACGQDIIWTEPRDVNLNELPLGINLPGKQPGRSNGILSSFHPEAAQVTLLDGSVMLVTEDMDAEVLQALLSGTNHSAQTRRK